MWTSGGAGSPSSTESTSPTKNVWSPAGHLVGQPALEPAERADEQRRARCPFAARDPVPEGDRRHAPREVLREPVLPVGEQAEREPARAPEELVHRRLPVDRHADERRLERERHQRADRQAQTLALRVHRQHGDAVRESLHQIPEARRRRRGHYGASRSTTQPPSPRR